jgi:sec-independent protein translocase protein TatA
MLGSIGAQEILLIFLVVLLLFGAKRIPEIGSAMGKGIREFKSSVRDIQSELNTTPKEREQLPPRGAPASTSAGEQDMAEARPVGDSGSSQGGSASA